MKTNTILTIILSLISTGAFALDPPPVGKAAPDFSLTDAKGQTHSLSQYKGKYVVLEWFNPQCPFVKKHYGSGNMQKLQEKFIHRLAQERCGACCCEPSIPAHPALGVILLPNKPRKR